MRKNNMKRHIKKRAPNIIMLIVLLFAFYYILDYVNAFSLIGLSLSNIDIDIFSLFFNTAIVLVLYVISFYYIDNKQNEKDANAKDAACTLLKKSYQECLSNLEFLDNNEVIGKYIIPKVNGNKTDSENKVVNNLQTLPFSSFDAIIDLATNGYIEKEQLDNYLDIKKEYQYLVSMKITFFDMVHPDTLDQKVLYNDIKARDSALKEKLNIFINS